MTNIQVVSVLNEFTNETVEHVIIAHEDGGFTSMPKAVWDEQQKAAELGGTL